MDADQYRMMMETLTDMSKTLNSIRIGVIIIVMCIVAYMAINLFLMCVDNDDED